ncbi:hypothetical protein M3P05_02515 [Sansalvadorimonas sp. 2012CJ34-2]|uniref:Uncharacterized protein n=1 Tax=Parendozoicomonas callyspongiae TaxID=2942213 RepID=A0ABT0PC03_9GAMM|nr:hypothetical protein [Sansalvadorimonas sp. 2012CJ34-2]MCL6268823.1 hypothetical protein [Sansalvadorimonas sp. 2012CJ34-2]
MQYQSIQAEPAISKNSAVADQAPFEDPKKDMFPWAASLRPQTCGTKPKDRTLDSRVIYAVSDFNMRKKNSLCVVGSRVLQRIIATRYLKSKSIEDGRDYYHTTDIDVWMRYPGQLDQLIAHLEQSLPHIVSGYSITSHQQTLFVAGLQYASVAIKSECETSRKPKELLSKVDITAPLHNDCIVWDKFNSCILEAERLPMADFDANNYAQIDSLSDLNYLKAQRLALESLQTTLHEKDEATRKKLIEVTLPFLVYMEVTRYLSDCNEPDSFTVELLKLYCDYIPEKAHELGRILSVQFQDQWQRLKTIHPGLIADPAPEVNTSPAEKRTDEKTPQSYAAVASSPSKTPDTPGMQLYQHSPCAKKTRKSPFQPTTASTTESTRKKGSTKKKEKKRKSVHPAQAETDFFYSDPSTIPQKQLQTIIQRLLQETKIESRISILEENGLDVDILLSSNDTDLAEDFQIIATLITQPAEQLSNPAYLQKTDEYPSQIDPLTSLSPEVIQDFEDQTETESPQASKPKKLTCYDSLRRTLEGTPSIKHKKWNPGEFELTRQLLSFQQHAPPLSPKPADSLEQKASNFRSIISPLILEQTEVRNSRERYPVIILSELAKLRTDTLHKLQFADLNNIPYANYLQGILTLKGSKTAAAYHALFHAAKAGVTGAALELLRKSLTNNNFPIPTSAIMRLLKSCLERPKPRQLPLRFQYKPIRAPYDVADLVIAAIEKEIVSPISRQAWQKIGDRLKTAGCTELSIPDDIEKCLLVATCSYSFAENSSLVSSCQKSIPKQATTQSNLIRNFDWFIQRLPIQTDQASKISGQEEATCQHLMKDKFKLPASITDWPQAVFLVNLLTGNDSVLEKSIESLDNKFFWYDWLPYCLSENHDFDWLKSMPELRSHWKQTQRIRKICEKEQPVVVDCPPNDFQPVQPFPARSWVSDADEQFSSKIRKFASAYATLDEQILSLPTKKPSSSRELNPSDSDPLQPMVFNGSQLTVQALKALGASPNKSAKNQIDIPLFSEDQRTQAMKLLAQAVTEYGNPYACWIYARLLRPELKNYLALPEVEEQWYNDYLSLLVFATSMGVAGASDDLFAELLEGRADALLETVIEKFIARYSMSRVFSVKFNFPPLTRNHSHQRVCSYTANESDSNWADWIAQIKSCYPMQSSDIQKTGQPKVDTLHHNRLEWIDLILGIFLDIQNSSVNASSLVDMNFRQAAIPLQIAIKCAVEKITIKNKSALLQRLNIFLSHDLKLLISDMHKDEQIHTDQLNDLQLEKIIRYLCWQPLSPYMNRIWDPIKDKIHPSKKAASDNARQLIMFCDYTTLCDTAKQIPDPAQGHIRSIWKWLVLYQQLRQGTCEQAVLALPDLTQQASDISRMDDLLWQHITGRAVEDPDYQSLYETLKNALLDTENEHGHKSVFLTIASTSAEKLIGLVSQHARKTVDPYFPLLAGLGLEAKDDPRTFQITTLVAGYQFFYSCLLGSDSAARHLGRLAFKYYNSPVSIERVLNCYLLQAVRKRRHRIDFICESSATCSSGAERILDALDQVCLQAEKGGESSQRTALDIIDQLIPLLKQIRFDSKHSDLRSQLSLMLSHCYKFSGVCKLRSLFDTSDAEHCSYSTLHQWKMHITSFVNEGQIAKETVKSVLNGINKMLKKFGEEGQISARVSPFVTVYGPENEKEEKQCTAWKVREGYLFDIPVMLGQKEWHDWSKALNESQSCSILGDIKTFDHSPVNIETKRLHFNQMSIQLSIFDALLTSDVLQIPSFESHLETTQQQAYDQYRIEKQYLELKNSSETQPEDCATAIPPSASKKKRKKKHPKKKEPVAEITETVGGPLNPDGKVTTPTDKTD